MSDQPGPHRNSAAGRTTPTPDAAGLTQLLADVLREAKSRFAADDAVLYVHDEAAGGFAGVGVHDSGVGLIERQLDAPLQEVLLDVLADRTVRPLSSRDRLSVRAEADNNIWLVPLVSQRPIGVLVLSNPRAPSDFATGVVRGVAERIDGALAGEDDSPSYRVLQAEGTGVAVVEGPNHIVTYASDEFRRSLALVSVPFLARPVGNVLPAALRDPLLSLLERVGESRVASSRQYLEWRDQYGPRYLEYEVLPGVRSDSCIIAVWPRTEATVTRQALQSSVVALADSQRTLAAVLNNTNNGIFFISPDLTVLYANRRMGEMFGIDVRQTIGRNKREAISNYIMHQMEDPEDFAARLSYLYDHITEIAVDEVVVARPIRRILERYSAPVYKDDGTLLGRIEVYSDVTEVRQLQHNKDEFLSLVSHELRTPVTSIKGYAQLLKRRAMQQPVSNQTMVAYDTIERQTLRMQDLIDTLLNLSRLESGRLQLDPVKLDFVALVKHTVSMIRITAERHRFLLDMPSKPLWIEGDERRLEQIMTNLLTNAVRYSEAGSTVTVAVAGNSEEVSVSVTDEGIGIAPDARERIFERFFRVDGAPESTGLGIGLYITKQFVEQHGGTIEVQSEVGAGTTFIVRFPRRVPVINPEL